MDIQFPKNNHQMQLKIIELQHSTILKCTYRVTCKLTSRVFENRTQERFSRNTHSGKLVCKFYSTFICKIRFFECVLLKKKYLPNHTYKFLFNKYRYML
jgi:hypothetical protein